MMDSGIFPKSVQEVLDFWIHGDILGAPYGGTAPPERLVKSMKAAVDLYTDQDVAPPLYFLQDISNDANGEIPLPDTDQEDMDTALIELYDEMDLKIILNKVKALESQMPVSDHMAAVIAGSIAENLYNIARSRLLMPRPHPFFEKLFGVLKNQGFPCAWIGGADCHAGDFIIFSR
jgi:hypothetical protein